MIADKVKDELFKMQDTDYRDLISKLIPTVDKEMFIGIRIPKLREYAKQLIKKDEGITVYSYVYNAKRRIPEVFEYKNPKYDDIIEALEEAGYIKKI